MTVPALVIIDVQPKEEYEIPTKGYVAIEDVKEVQFQFSVATICG